MNFMKNIIILCTAIFALNAGASEYKNSYYEEEGDLLFKIRGFYAKTDGKLKKLPASQNNADTSISLANNGYGVDGSVTYFFTQNLATELSLGFGMIKVKSSELAKAKNAFGTGVANTGKKNEIYYVPATAAVQYHIAPFGAIRPYVGGGYSGSFMFSRSKAIEVAHGHGAVIQAGIDFVSKDDTIFTFDVKQFFLKSKVKLKKSFLYPNNANAGNIGSKATWNPLVVSAGIGFKF